MLDRVVLLLAAEDAALAAVDIHGFEELFFAVHRLELDVGVPARGRVVFLVLIASLQDVLSLPLQVLDLLLSLLNGRFGLVGGLLILDCLVKLLLLNQKLSHLFHVLQVAEVGQAELHVPHIVLVFVNFTSVRVQQFHSFLGAHIFNPCVVDARQVIK